MNYTHPKEARYTTLGRILGGLFWISPLGWACLALVPFAAFTMWYTRKFLEAYLYGNAIEVNEQQYPELYTTVVNYSATLELKSLPTVFIMEGHGYKNALAAKFLSKKFVILFSDIVATGLEADDGSLNFIIGHELAHHAKGHTSFWLNLWMAPVSIFPPLYLAWKRNSEYTADGIGMGLCGDPNAAAGGLALLAGKPFGMKSKINVQALMAQEQKLPKLFSFYEEIYSSHPRITLRLIHINQAYPLIIKAAQEANARLAQRQKQHDKQQQVAQGQAQQQVAPPADQSKQA